MIRIKENYRLRKNLTVICFSVILSALVFDAGLKAAAPVTYLTSPNLSNPGQVPINDIFEITFEKNVGNLVDTQNNWITFTNLFIVQITATFTSPANKQTTIEGFWYTQLTNGNSLWKLRFVPAETGTWSYSYTFNDTKNSEISSGSGTFNCIAGSNPGFIKINPNHPMRWIHANGSAYWPCGFNDGIGFGSMGCIDGGDKNSAFDSACHLEDYWNAYSAAGFNIFRLSPGNGAPTIFNWNGSQGINLLFPNGQLAIDDGMLMIRRHNVRLFLGLFTNFYWSSPVPASVFDYVRYCINAWSSIVDIWEINNEVGSADASAGWLHEISQYIKTHDPYNHAVSQGFERPENPDIDVCAPHTYTYAYTGNYGYDNTIAGMVNQWKSYNKPILSGEAGNGGINSVWFSDSGTKFRVELWAGMLLGMSFAYWNTSYETVGYYQNIYLGPEERQYIGVARWFSEIAYKSDSAEINPSISGTGVSVYGLSSSEGAALYLYYNVDPATTVSGRTVTVNIPAAGTGYWIDPKTGKKISAVSVTSGSNALSVPSFLRDIAFFSTANSNLKTKPVSAIKLTNPQNDGDLDNNGIADFGPVNWWPFGQPPLTLTFDAGDSYDFDGGAVTCSWDFGDGTQGSGSLVNHTFQYGNYTMSLTVTDDEGQTAKQYLFVRAVADPHPNVNDPPKFIPKNNMVTTIKEGEVFTFLPWAYVEELSGGAYSWDTSTCPVKGLPAGAKIIDCWGKDCVYWQPTYNQSGTYTMNFTVTDAGGLTDTESITLTVLNVDPIGAPSQPTIIVQSPNGGETWAQGTLQTVTWTSANLTGNVNIEITTNGGTNWTSLAGNTANDGTQSVTMPLTPSTTCRVRVSGASGTPNDSSDNNFTISLPPVPTITVQSPNGGEAWTQGTTQTVTWTSTNLTENINIEITMNGGASWVFLASNTSNDGIEAVTVPTTLSTTCKVRVSAVSGTPNDNSDNNFTITNVTRPIMSVSVTSIDFGSMVQGQSGTSTFNITYAGQGTLSGTLVCDRSWITVNPASFSGNSTTVTVTINTTGLTAGSNTGTITVTSNEGNATLDVTVNVTPVVANPQISLSSTSLSFGELSVGSVSEPQVLTIKNDGTGTLTGTISVSDSWITIDKISLNLASQAEEQVTVSVDNSVLAQKEGPAKGEITIMSNGNNGSQTTTIIVVEFTATCVLVKPNPVRLSSPLVGEGRGEGSITFFGDGIVPGQTTIKIYTLSGELVNILNPQSEICNTQSPQAPGIYIYIYESPKEKGIGKFTVTK